MKEYPEPEVIFTHESDLDGFFAGTLLARLARKLFGREVPLKAYHYSAWEGLALRPNRAWVTDLTFESRLDRPDWVIVDHHQPRATPERARFIHDTSKSAGSLAYDMCKAAGIQSEALDRLAHLNNVADLFLKDSPDFDEAVELAGLVKIYGFWTLHGLVEGEAERLLDSPLREVIRTKRRVEDPLGFEWSKNRITEISPKVGLVDTCVGDVNLIIHRLLEEKVTPYPVLMTLGGRGTTGTMSVSLRSENGEALSVAETLQGGGHPNACGASLPKTIHHRPDAILYLKKTLNPQVETPSEDDAVASLFEELG